jgi:hypothetical protein
MAYEVDYSPAVAASARRAGALTGLAGTIGGTIKEGRERHKVDVAAKKKRELAQKALAGDADAQTELNILDPEYYDKIMGSKRAEKARETAGRAVAGDEAALDELAYTSPEIHAGIMKRIGAKTEQQQKATIYDLSQAYSLIETGQTEAALEHLGKRAEAIEADPRRTSEHTRAIMNMIEANPEQGKQYIGMALQSMINPEAFAKGLAPKESAIADVAAVKEMEYLTAGLPEEDKARAMRIKLGLDPRASTSAEEAAAKEFAKQMAKLQARLKLEPGVAAAIAAAQNQAKAEADLVKEEKSNDAAWNVYNNSMQNLSQAMAETETGPVIGFIPAVTSNQQIAQGAQAVMAPILKQMFRSAGEGTFTDNDQKLLMQMVPTRKDTPEARIAKIKMIDDVVRAKLKMEGQTTGQPIQPAITQIRTDAEYDALPSGAEFIAPDGTTRRKP